MPARESAPAPSSVGLPAPGNQAAPDTDRPEPPAPDPTAPFTELHRRGQGPIRRFLTAHPLVVDVLVMAAYVIPTMIGAVAQRSVPIVWITIIGGVLLFGRRHRPLLTFGLLTALAGFTLALVGDLVGLQFALALSLYTVATLRRPRVAWPAMAISSAVVTANLIVAGSRDSVLGGPAAGIESALGVATGALVFAVSAMAIGISVRNRRENLQRLLDHGNQIALERDQRAQLAIAAERNRIAREMHDVVAHSLSVMVALADGAQASLHRKPEQSEIALHELSATGRSALIDTRRILGVLRDDGATPDGPTPTPDTQRGQGPISSATGSPPPDARAAAPGLPGHAPTAPQPDEGQVPELISRFHAAGVPIRHTHRGLDLPQDAALHLVVYRIVQEALTNVLRHCPRAAFIEVTVDVGDGEVGVHVENGPSAPASPPESAAAEQGHARADQGVGGQGLIGMRERAAVFGGFVSAGPTSTGGWRVEALLRFEAEDS